MNIALILPISFALGILSYSLIAKWYVMPRLASLPPAEALPPLLLPHAFRYIGLAFLIPGVTSEPTAASPIQPPMEICWRSERTE